MVIAGERRFRAFGLLERASIPAIISEGSADELALIENIQRENLSPIDEFQAITRLMEKHGYSQGEVAAALGKSRVSINDIMSLAGLAPLILDAARNANVTKSILVEIARAGNEARQMELWSAVQAGTKTVRALRAERKSSAGHTPEPMPIDAAIRAGRKFVAALIAIPADEGSTLNRIKTKMCQSLKSLEDELKMNSPDQSHYNFK